MRFVFNVIASVGRQIDVYRPIKIQKSYRPTVFFNVIAALSTRLNTIKAITKYERENYNIQIAIMKKKKIIYFFQKKIHQIIF